MNGRKTPDHGKVSRFLSFVLRHKPEEIGIELDKEGWTDIGKLVKAMKAAGHAVNRDILKAVVEANDKKRFALSADGSRIRAVQGHSTSSVEISFQAKQPPELLYQGTATRFLDSIMATGLNPGNRHHVHLSEDIATCAAVGARHGTPVILEIAAGSLAAKGHEFFQAENGVWLTKHVPPGRSRSSAGLRPDPLLGRRPNIPKDSRPEAIMRYDILVSDDGWTTWRKLERTVPGSKSGTMDKKIHAADLVLAQAHGKLASWIEVEAAAQLPEAALLAWSIAWRSKGALWKATPGEERDLKDWHVRRVGVMAYGETKFGAMTISSRRRKAFKSAAFDRCWKEAAYSLEARVWLTDPFDHPGRLLPNEAHAVASERQNHRCCFCGTEYGDRIGSRAVIVDRTQLEAARYPDAIVSACVQCATECDRHSPEAFWNRLRAEAGSDDVRDVKRMTDLEKALSRRLGKAAVNAIRKSWKSQADRNGDDHLSPTGNPSYWQRLKDEDAANPPMPKEERLKRK